MSRTEMLREVRMKRFEEVYDRWRRRRITQALAANVLGVTARTFRRWVVRYEAGGLAALKDKRVAGAEAGFGDDAAPGRLDARVGSGRAVGSRRDDGRRDGRGALGVLCGGGRDVVEPPGGWGDGGGQGALRQPCTRTGARTTGTRRRRAGRWTRTTRPSSAGRWASWGTRDDCRVLAAGAGPERAVLRNASGAAAAGAGSTGRSRCRRRRRRARSPLCSPP